jgi:CRISPR-associated protein (TIGR03986 family)
MDMISLPYNFVSLNDGLVVDAEELPNRRYFNTDRHTGMIKCKLTTLSPLYIAGEKGEFFHHEDPNIPVIPGSSLRGMIRSIVQVITWSKLQPVTDKEMYLRDIDNQEDYMNFMRDQVLTAFIKQDTGGLYLETCDYYKVRHFQMLAHDPDLLRTDSLPQEQSQIIQNWQNGVEALPETLPASLESWLNSRFKEKFFTKNSYPNWLYQNKSVWIKLSDKGHVIDFQIAKPSDLSEWKEGTLVLTGWLDTKKHEYVFVPQQNPIILHEAEITNKIQQLEDDDQISDWQKGAFPNDEPQPDARRKPGAVRNDEPVFYIKDGEQVKFLGRACLFRLPYGKSPHDLLPGIHRSSTQIDMTEAIFGFVEKDIEGKPAKSYAYKGRVSFTDGCYQNDGSSPWLKKEAFSPRILASPKPASYTTYLEQPAVRAGAEAQHETVRRLIKYSTQGAKLRGHKFYWHQAKQVEEGVKPLEYEDLRLPESNRNFEQSVKPVKKGVKFDFTVRFEDLTDVELGALLWALTLPGTEHLECAHKLGMGKSIGMGSAKIEAKELQMLHLEDRYGELDGKGLTSEKTDIYLEGFTAYMKGMIGQEFDIHPRIRQLRLLLSIPGVDWAMVKYSDTEGFKAYKDKPSLKSVDDVYKDAHLQTSGQMEVEAEDGEDSFLGHTVRGVVNGLEDAVWFKIKTPAEIRGKLGYVLPGNLAGKRYRIGFDITAVVINTEKDGDDTLFECTLDFPKDLK